MVSARSWRWTLPYFSFFRIARAASVGPVACKVMASTRSGIPLRSSSSNWSLVRRSMATVTEEYGFFYRPCLSEPDAYKTFSLISFKYDSSYLSLPLGCGYHWIWETVRA